MTHIPTFNGNAKIIPNRTKFGTHGCYFDGTGGYLTAPVNAAWTITNNWTLDLWFNVADTVGTQYLVQTTKSDGTDRWYLNMAGSTLGWYYKYGGTSGIAITKTGIVSNRWYHVAVVHENDWYAMYVDGVHEGNDADINEPGASGDVLSIGCYVSGVTVENYFGGWFDDLRITQSNVFSADASNGASTITVPTAAHSTDGNTQLSLDFDIGNISSSSSDQSLIDKSASPHAITPYGTAGAMSRFGGGAYSLGQATGDYLTIPDSTGFDVFESSTDNWTVDFWFNSFSDTAGNAAWISQEEDAGNYFRFYDRTGGDPMTMVLHSGSANVILANTNSMDRTTHTWYHVALCKVADEYGIYLNGTQIDYDQSTSVDTLAGDLIIGAQGSTGYQASSPMMMDEIRYQHSNYFDAAPVLGDTDTISVPTEAYNTNTVSQVDATATPSALNNTLAIATPVTVITDTEIPSAFATALSLLAPVTNAETAYEVPATLDVSITLDSPSTITSDSQVPNTFDLTASVLAPNIDIVTARTVYPILFRLALSPQDATAHPLPPKIPRYAYDPIVRAGCPQCGTFLYKKRGKEIRTHQVTRGRNFDHKTDDRYIRCGRCNFPVKVDRHTAHPEGARTGWGKTDTVQSHTWAA